MSSPSDEKPAPKPSKTNLVALRDAREQAIELISQRFSEDVIDDEEMERRLELTQAATSLEDLAEITDDLRSPSRPSGDKSAAQTALVPAGEQGLAAHISADAVPAETRSTTILGDNKRDGAWVPARRIMALNVLGESTFDFRDARLGPGEINLRVRCVLGNVKLIVPPGLPVEIDCPSVLASIKRQGRFAEPSAHSDDAPRIRVTGFVTLGELQIEERLPGESQREAKKRHKRERKELQKARKRRRLGDGS